ncbi:B3/B4 domain-containing protein [Vagococcus hydrophili]|uniref:B3/B4 tRNA-binding domain-containing protein n=1 Tax=Vagococcus hydrophili TaxID=2714947 RepID=A0A6G8ASC2_9ENTE|nr:phenylalanine--tRNA ligase beta subunit-related protein [Vagococcus hydrophili]QIL47869.1 hypothetical protein G7082_04650 [Vagococcus hydrophili]
MKKFTVEPSFFEVFEEAQFNVLVLEGIDNRVGETEDAAYLSLLAEGALGAKKHLSEENFTDNQVIAEWREAFRQFKTKKGARSSIEALLKRVHQDRVFMPINPLVDIYNSVSLKYAVPCGGEDIESIMGDLKLKKATGGESFLPLGAEEDSPALPEEIIYADDEGAICRSMNWREAQRTMLTESTTQAILVIESINAHQKERSDLAIEELKELVETYLKVAPKLYTVNKNQPTIIISE